MRINAADASAARANADCRESTASLGVGKFSDARRRNGGKYGRIRRTCGTVMLRRVRAPGISGRTSKVRRSGSTYEAGAMVRSSSEGDLRRFALSPGGKHPGRRCSVICSVPSGRCAYAPYPFTGVFCVLHFFASGVCLLSGLSVRLTRSRSVLSAKAARSRAAPDDAAAPLSLRFPLPESVHRFRGRCFLA